MIVRTCVLIVRKIIFIMEQKCFTWKSTVVTVGRGWIGVMSSEKKHRQKKMPGRGESKFAGPLRWSRRDASRRESKCRLPQTGIPSRQSDKSTGAADVAWRCSRILDEKVQDRR